MKANIIVLNGTSSAGKSTLVRALRPLLPANFCYYASDQLADQSFRPSQPDVRLDGRNAFFDGFHRSIAAFASAGLDMVVEHIVERASWAEDLNALLRPFDVFWVGVFAPLETLDQRERDRGDRTIGEAREHLGTHNYCHYDVSVTMLGPAHQIAEQVAHAWRRRQPRNSRLNA